MKTHKGEKITGKRLEEARNYAASFNEGYAKSILAGEVEFASHVTKEEQLEMAAKKIKLAEEVKQGLHDGNFTIWQRMNFFLTGESVAFLAS